MNSERSGPLMTPADDLGASLLSFQNLSVAEKQRITDIIESNKKLGYSDNIQMQALGFLFLTIVGEENFASVLAKARKIQGSPPLVPGPGVTTPPAVPPAAGPPAPAVNPPIVPPPVPPATTPPPAAQPPVTTTPPIVPPPPVPPPGQ